MACFVNSYLNHDLDTFRNNGHRKCFPPSQDKDRQFTSLSWLTSPVVFDLRAAASLISVLGKSRRQRPGELWKPLVSRKVSDRGTERGCVRYYSMLMLVVLPVRVSTSNSCLSIDLKLPDCKSVQRTLTVVPTVTLSLSLFLDSCLARKGSLR
ncbi:hypothetical protein J6590_059957 [Homalodisca vitripennis]|nr:hypothetical protein J6590_059957 [Homalodisca vitripennis]